MRITETGGTVFVLPLGVEEIHHLDAQHVAAIDHDGTVEVVRSVGTCASLTYEVADERYEVV